MCVALPPLKEFDHSKAMKDLAKAQIPLYASQGTFNDMKVNGNAMIEGKVYKIGEFRVLGFKNSIFSYKQFPNRISNVSIISG